MKLTPVLLCYSLSLFMYGCQPVASQTLKGNPLTVASAKADAVDTHTLIIFYDDTVGDKELLQAIKEYGAEIVYEYTNLKGLAITVPANHSPEETRAHFLAVKGVLSVEYNQIMHTDSSSVNTPQ